MKKIALASIATLSILFAGPGMIGAGMKYDCKCMKQGSMMEMKQKMMRKKMNSPFLIKHGLPHLTKNVMMNWDNVAFGLTAEQKEKLTAVRKETMGAVMRLKPEVMALKKEIVQASTSGTKAADLKEKVDKLASMEAEATMVHLNCIEKTKDILTKDQLLFLLANKNTMHGMQGKMMKKRMGQGKGMKMKCGSGKCGMGMKQGAGKIQTH
ncbi:hypothetical protein [Sulfurovum lithotrophicum]|uniref:hypothetical protein n=1 Tax=Sulfurovum lithotrophicum TaxID=206403 RepID=UPI000699150B|nr:hypothetical protein [Sulfurovum lithotrophicum]